MFPGTCQHPALVQQAEQANGPLLAIASVLGNNASGKQADLPADVILTGRNTRLEICEKLKPVLLTFPFFFFFQAAGH